MLFYILLNPFALKRSDQDLNKRKEHKKEQKQQTVAMATNVTLAGMDLTRTIVFQDQMLPRREVTSRDYVFKDQMSP